MKITVPKITKQLDLGDYAEELRGVCIEVHVNPAQARLAQLAELERTEEEIRQLLVLQPAADGLRALAGRLNEAGKQLAAWYAETWSWPIEDVLALAEQARDTDPGLLAWMAARTQELIDAHRAAVKKASGQGAWLWLEGEKPGSRTW
jgi:hypothetical protein